MRDEFGFYFNKIFCLRKRAAAAECCSIKMADARNGFSKNALFLRNEMSHFRNRRQLKTSTIFLSVLRFVC